MRMQLRRLTRLTNAFADKVKNHDLSAAHHYMHDNFRRIHKSLRVTPAMAPGMTDHICDMTEIALIAAEETPVAKRWPHKNKAA
jgi:hypothetical protein